MLRERLESRRLFILLDRSCGALVCGVLIDRSAWHRCISNKSVVFGARVGSIYDAIVHHRWATVEAALWFGTATNRQGTETAFEWALLFYFHFHFWDLRTHGHYGAEVPYIYKIRCLSVVLSICKSFAIVLSVTSLYSVYVVSEISCTVTGC